MFYGNCTAKLFGWKPHEKLYSIFFLLQAVTCERVEAAAKLSQTIMEERSQKDIEMQQVLAQARASIPATVNLASERMDDVTLLTDGKNTYTVQFINSTEQTPVDSDHE